MENYGICYFNPSSLNTKIIYRLFQMNRHVFLVALLLLSVQCQIRRNIAYTFLQMDKNGNFILESNEVFPNEMEAQSLKDEVKYTWDKFQTIFPILKALEWDKDRDYKLSKEEFAKMIDEDFIKKETALEGFKSFSEMFKTDEERFNMCSQNGEVTPKNFAVCMGVWLGFEKDLFEHRVPSFFKMDKSPDTFITYKQFKDDIMKAGDSSSKQEKDKISEMYRLFERPHDGDTVLDNNEIKLLQPMMLLSLLDKTRDMILTKDEGVYVFSEDYGGEKVFDFADLNDDGKLTKNEFFAHMVFALDLDDSKVKESTTKESKTNDKIVEEKEDGPQKMEL